ncbi:MAG: hypothetical protein HUK22_02035 [Thermoguttaceae bacterium]|nr:hypothetical protein [Thermoguttaceae bacterium]
MGSSVYEGGKRYLCGYDATFDRAHGKFATDASVALEDFCEAVGAVGARRSIVMVDCCRSWDSPALRYRMAENELSIGGMDDFTRFVGKMRRTALISRRGRGLLSRDDVAAVLINSIPGDSKKFAPDKSGERLSFIADFLANQLVRFKDADITDLLNDLRNIGWDPRQMRRCERGPAKWFYRRANGTTEEILLEATSDGGDSLAARVKSGEVFRDDEVRPEEESEWRRVGETVPFAQLFPNLTSIIEWCDAAVRVFAGLTVGLCLGLALTFLISVL